MKNWSIAEKTAWASDNALKETTIEFINPISRAVEVTLTNNDIVSESLEISQILESENCLTFAGANASSCKFRCRDIAKDIRGYEVRILIKLADSSFPAHEIFYGTVQVQENQNHEDILTTITALDAMAQIYKLDLTSWWKSTSIANGATFETYVKRIANKFVSDTYATIFSDANYEKFANMNLTISAKPDLVSEFGSVSGEMLIKWIAQAANVYITCDGRKLTAIKLEPMQEGLHPHIGLYPRSGLYPSGGIYNMKYSQSEYISCRYEPYKVAQIDQVVITDREGIGEGQAPTTPGTNVLYIDSNPFLWAMNMMDAAANIFDRVKDIYFTPSNIKAKGLPFVELGDIVKVYSNKNVIYAYVLQRSLKGIQFLTDTYQNQSTQYQSSHSPTYAEVTNENGKKILKLQADVVQVNELAASKVSADEVRAMELSADKITAGTLDASKVTINNLQVTNSMISGTISTNHLSTNYASASNFTVPYTGFHMGNYAVSIQDIVDKNGNVWHALCAYFE